MFPNIVGFSTNHCHTDTGSNLRMLDSISKIKALLDRAIELKYTGLCLTEHEALTSHIQMMSLIKEYKEGGKLSKEFKVGYGNEIYLVNSIETCRNKLEKYHHFIVVAKDKYGHEILRRLSSCAWSQSYFTGRMRRCPIEKAQLKNIMTEFEGKGHIQISTACLGSELAQLVLKFLKDNDPQTKRDIGNYINFCIETFGRENVFLEIQASFDEEQIAYNKFIMLLAKGYKLPVQITNDVHYTKEEHREIHSAFLKSRDGDGNRETDIFYKTCYMMKIEELWEHVKGYLTQEEFVEVVNNTTKFLNQLEDYDLFQGTIVPARDISQQEWELKHIFSTWYSKYPYIEKFAKSEHEQDRFFLSEIEKGFVSKGFEFNDENVDRINKELEELWFVSDGLGDRMSKYYVLVQYLIEIIWRISVVGASRGSIAGFFTAYLIDIHQINPMEFGLTQYWRHIERNKVSWADIDIDASGDKKQQILEEVKKELGYQNVLNIMTLKTEKTKSAVLTVMRGIGVNNDEAQYIASLIEQERGFLFSLKDTWYGNEEKERKPNTQFINEINRLSEEKEMDVKSALFMIEDMVSGYSSHACGVNIYNNGFIKQNSMMLTPNGLPVTAWTMNDSELVGDLKVDFLSTDAVSKMQLCLEYLVKDRVIEEQGSLRDTYNKYLHPDIVNRYDNPVMWDKMNNLEIPSLFQFGDSEVGRTAMKKVKPNNIYELATANSLMRLMATSKDAMTPLDKYVAYKQDITLAYEEMDRYGLTKAEREVVKRRIGGSLFYCCDTQEVMMEVLMDEEVANFSRRESDGARKIVGKKLMKKIPQLKEDYFEKGRKVGTTDNLLNYMWDICILPQLGYSFSILHTTGYSMIAIQEAFLSTKYNPLYWACAVLTSNSGSIYDETEEEDEILDEDGEIIEAEIGLERKKVVTNYDKVARAIGDLNHHNIKVSPPYINKANFSFTPDVKGNQIVYSLKAINGVSDETAEKIVKERTTPYKSFIDFLNRVEPKNKEIYALIKSGCFDEFEKDRIELMKEFVSMIVGVKTSVNGQNLDFFLKNNLIPETYSLLTRFCNYKKYIFNKKFLYEIDEDSKSNKTPKKWYLLDAMSAKFFNEHFISKCVENKHYKYLDNGSLIVIDKDFTTIIKKEIEPISEWMATKGAVDAFNQLKFDEEWNKNCSGNISKWEMESLCYYYHEHELSKVDLNKYVIKNFFDMEQESVIVGHNTFKINRGKENEQTVTYPIFEINRICGTVIARNNTKHIVTLLTPHGVVDLKFQGGAYSFYNKQISTINADGSKTIAEKSFFKRGQKLIVTGYRRDDMFAVKRYKNTIFQHTVEKILEVTEDNELKLQQGRIEV